MSSVEKVVLINSITQKGFVKYYSYRKHRRMGKFVNLLMQLRLSRWIYKLLFKQHPGVINKNQRVYSAQLVAEAFTNSLNVIHDVKFVGEYDHPIETELKI